MLPRPHTLLPILLIPLLGFSQPEQWGCHYFRNQAPQRVAYTDAERALINESIARSDTFNILHYDITIDVTDYAGQTIKASTEITFTPLMAGQNTIRFDLLQLTVDSVTSPTGPLTFNHDGTFLTINLAPTPNIGDTLALTVHYQGTPHRDPYWGGFYFDDGYIYNLGIGLTTVPPNFGKVWYPCFDSFVERATYTYHVMSSGTFRAHCQGEFLGEITLNGDTVVRSFTLQKEIPTHASAIAVADYRDSTFIHNGAYGQVPVTFTAKPTDLNNMVARMHEVGGSIDALEFWYGPNPFDRVGYVITTDGALEIPTNIAYPDHMPNQPVQDNRELLAHELGHHWWGDEVTPWSHEHMWLKEGPAEYSQHLTEEWIGGRDAMVDMAKRNQLDILKNAHRDDQGYHPLSPMPDAHIYGTHSYYKGASVMHNMRAYLGDPLFRMGMHSVQQMLGSQTMTPEQFRDSLTAATGVDMNPFFDGWVFQPGYATYVVDSMATINTPTLWNVQLRIRQLLHHAVNYHTDVPLQVTLIGADREAQDHWITVGGHLTNVTLQNTFEPVMAIIDRHNHLNLARLRHEVLFYPGNTITSVQPYVDVQLFDDALTDSTWVNIDHIWARPEGGSLGPGVIEVSDAHYWIVNGIWPAGTDLRMRIFYNGNDPDDLDFAMLNTNEPEVMLVYRATPQDPWEAYFDATINYLNNQNDGRGRIEASSLLPGEYAFARGNAQVGVDESEVVFNTMEVYPSPTDGTLFVKGDLPNGTVSTLLVSDLQGRVILTEPVTLTGNWSHQMDVRYLPSGAYLLRSLDTNGNELASERFVKR